MLDVAGWSPVCRSECSKMDNPAEYIRMTLTSESGRMGGRCYLSCNGSVEWQRIGTVVRRISYLSVFRVIPTKANLCFFFFESRTMNQFPSR